MTAEVKKNTLWNNILTTRYDPLNDIIPEADTNVINPVCTEHVFIDKGDTMQNGRTKSIHKRGMTFLAKYIPVQNNHNFTGIFRNGCEHAICRFSYANCPIKKDGVLNLTYGFAMKFLLSNKPSANIFGMHSLDGQNTYNLFKYNYTNTLPQPSSYKLKFGSYSFRIAKWLGQTSWFPSLKETNPLHLSVKNVGLEDNIIASYPETIIYVPSEETKNFITEEKDFRILLNGKLNNTKIFDVYETEVKESSRIGEIHATSEFVTSRFGDSELFFQHGL